MYILAYIPYTDHAIYRKPTHIDRYLHFASHHPHVKKGMVSCLFHRARTVAQGENVAAEELLRGVFQGNGYPKAFVKTASKPHRAAAEPAEEPRATAFIPYVAGLNEDVRQVCRRYDIRTIFRSSPTLCRQLMRVKDRDPLQKKSSVQRRQITPLC